MDKDRELQILEDNLPRLIRATLNFMWLVQDAREKRAIASIDAFREERDYHRVLCGAIKQKLHGEGRVESPLIDWNALYRVEYVDSNGAHRWNGSTPDIDA